jgi:hypothetical protein
MVVSPPYSSIAKSKCDNKLLWQPFTLILRQSATGAYFQCRLDHICPEFAGNIDCKKGNGLSNAAPNHSLQYCLALQDRLGSIRQPRADDICGGWQVWRGSNIKRATIQTSQAKHGA